MKILKNIKFVLPALFFLAGCSDDETYQPGAGEQESTYGVYFPSQATSSELDIDPNDPAEVSYRVKRTNAIDQIVVPLVVETSEEGIFEIEPLAFGPGEEETTLKIKFPAAKIGKEYTCSVRIEDPRYVSIYGTRNTGISFSVVRASWKLLGTGKWRDGILSDLYSLDGMTPNAEISVDIYEREDKPGYLRMKAFTPELLYAIYHQSVSTQGVTTIIDATDPAKVWIPLQETGIQLMAIHGYISIASRVAENFSLDDSDSQYGTLSEEGIITFPAQSIMVHAEKEPEGAWYALNTRGLQRIMLPGARAYEYSATLTKSEPANGLVQIGVTFGKDTRSMRYTVFEGSFDDAQASLYAQEMAENPEATDGTVTASGTLDIACNTTGKYTLVGCLYGEDAEKMQNYVYISFGYVAAEDDRPVILTVGLEGTNEMAGLGYTTDNSAKFYAYGENIESAEYGIFRSDDLHLVTPEEMIDSEGIDFTAEELAKINDKYYSSMLTGLNGDSEYTLVVRANNGYFSKILTAEIKTTGTFNPALESYNYMDFLPNMQQPTKEKLIDTKWNYYAVNLIDEKPVRRKQGVVTFRDYEVQNGTDFMMAKGLGGVEFDDGGGELPVAYIPGTSQLAGEYLGAFTPMIQQTPAGTIDGSKVYYANIALEDSKNLYVGSGMFAGAVAEGYLYFVPSPIAMQQNLTFKYLYVGSSNKIHGMLTEMMLVDPAVDMGDISETVLKRMARMREEIALRAYSINYVELPEYRLSAESVTAPKYDLPMNLASEPVAAGVPAAKVAGAKTTFRHGIPFSTAVPGQVTVRDDAQPLELRRTGSGR